MEKQKSIKEMSYSMKLFIIGSFLFYLIFIIVYSLSTHSYLALILGILLTIPLSYILKKVWNWYIKDLNELFVDVENEK